MTSKQHPYPEHVVEAVAYHLAPWLLRGVPATAVTDRVLQALWDASRVDSIDEIDDLPDHAVVIDKIGFVGIGREHASSNIDYEDYPVHVIHWGDRDA